MSFGFRIGPERPRADRALIERYGKLPVACISDAMMRVSAGGSRLRPMGPSTLAGSAITVRTPPGDNLMVHKALTIANPGDVVVVDSGGDLTNAIIGERMVAFAVSRGLAGIVVNGAVRDLAYLRTAPIPIFAAGVTHRGPYKNGPGEINYPIALDGMVIESGDILLGDDDGLLCIPFRDAEAIFPLALAKAEKEATLSPLEDDRAWIDRKLTALHCEVG